MTEKETEEKILDAATDIFLKRGMDGAKMQEIADRAGINKALLHYYYRSKEKLFLTVFRKVFPRILPGTLQVFQTNLDFFEKLKGFIDGYITILSTYRELPLFIIGELTRNPDIIVQSLTDTLNSMDFDIIGTIEEDLRREKEAGHIIDIDARQLMVNVISLCIFPFAGRPVIKLIAFENDEEAYDVFLSRRREEVYSFVVNSIRKPT